MNRLMISHPSKVISTNHTRIFSFTLPSKRKRSPIGEMMEKCMASGEKIIEH